jgi:hypothetical protein
MNRLPVPLILALALLPLVAVSGDAGKIETLQGQVASVDAAAMAVAVTPQDPAGKAAPGKPMRLKVDEETKIVKDGAPIKLSDLQRGDLVVVNYRGGSEAAVAVSIGVQKGKSG